MTDGNCHVTISGVAGLSKVQVMVLAVKKLSINGDSGRSSHGECAISVIIYLHDGHRAGDINGAKYSRQVLCS